MASGNSEQNGMITGINVTPMVDIVLVLLIIFIVTARIVVNPALTMDLPQAASAGQVQVIFSVVVPRQGPILINGEPVANEEEVKRMAGAAKAKDLEVRAVVAADGDVPHRRVVHAMDLLRQGGLYKIALATAALSDAEPPK